jgi:SAM-dependent methyltransferase
MPSPLRLDLACGERKEPGFVGVDQMLYPGVDLVWNLDHYPYPLPDKSVDEVRCFHFIEHVENLVAFMEELYRIMKPGATGVLAAPFWSHVNTWRDPTHRRGIAEQTLMFFNRDYRERNKKGCYGIKADFEVGYSINLDPSINFHPPAQLEFMKRFCVNVFFDITFTIRKVIKESDFPKTWECKVCGSTYTDREKGSGTKCWQGHDLTKIEGGTDGQV